MGEVIQSRDLSLSQKQGLGIGRGQKLVHRVNIFVEPSDITKRDFEIFLGAVVDHRRA